MYTHLAMRFSGATTMLQVVKMTFYTSDILHTCISGLKRGEKMSAESTREMAFPLKARPLTTEARSPFLSLPLSLSLSRRHPPRLSLFQLSIHSRSLSLSLCFLRPHFRVIKRGRRRNPPKVRSSRRNVVLSSPRLLSYVRRVRTPSFAKSGNARAPPETPARRRESPEYGDGGIRGGRKGWIERIMDSETK